MRIVLYALLAYAGAALAYALWDRPAVKFVSGTDDRDELVHFLTKAGLTVAPEFGPIPDGPSISVRSFPSANQAAVEGTRLPFSHVLVYGRFAIYGDPLEVKAAGAALQAAGAKSFGP